LSNKENVEDIINKKLQKLEDVPPTEQENDDPLSMELLFTKKKDIESAKALASKYLADYAIEGESDRNMLRQVIYLEVFHRTLQKAANDYDKGAGSVPLQVLEALHKNINQIVSLKEKLGILKKNTKDEKEGFKALKLLEKKFKAWEAENQGSRTMICPHCGKMVLLKILMDKWEALKHPFFVDRILANRHLIRLFKEKKITKRDIALVLNTSEDYVSSIIEKIDFSKY